MKDPTPIHRFGAAGLLVFAVVLHASTIPIDYIDDAYISFRYAWHLSHGNGLVFNPGTFVEGYSNLTWVLMASALLKLGLPLEVGMRVIAVSFLAATPVLIQSMLLSIGATLGTATGVGLLLACSTAWVLPTLNGLEGALFSFLLVCVSWLNWRTSPALPRVAAASGLVGVILSATRPEGAALYLLQLATAAALDFQAGRGPELRSRLRALLVFAAGFAALAGWRLATYGSLVPNTVLAKLGSPLRPFARVVLSPYGDGLLYAIGFIKATFPLWALLGIFAWSLRRRPQPDQVSAPATLPILISTLVGSGFGIIFLNNGDWMPDYRLLAPYVPLLVIATGGLFVRAPSRPGRVALLCAIALSLDPSRLETPAAAHLLTHKPSAFYQKLCGLGRDTYAATSVQERTVVAVEVLGVFGYCAPLLEIRDLNGLTDREIALHEPSSGTFGRKTSAASLEAMRPDIIMYSGLNNLRILIGESPWFSKEFLGVSCPRLLGDPLFLYFFVRRGSPLATPGSLPICPGEREGPEMIFRMANCRLRDWPYPFPRDCPPRGLDVAW